MKNSFFVRVVAIIAILGIILAALLPALASIPS